MWKLFTIKSLKIHKEIICECRYYSVIDSLKQTGHCIKTGTCKTHLSPWFVITYNSIRYIKTLIEWILEGPLEFLEKLYSVLEVPQSMWAKTLTCKPLRSLLGSCSGDSHGLTSCPTPHRASSCSSVIDLSLYTSPHPFAKQMLVWLHYCPFSSICGVDLKYRTWARFGVGEKRKE